MKKNIFWILFSIVLLASCSNKEDKKGLQNGRWRGEFTIQGQQSPFVFDVTNANTDSVTVCLLNGNERVVLTGLQIVGDSVTIPIEAYDTKLVGTISKGTYTGRFIKNFIENDEGIPFTAISSEASRFEMPNNATQTQLDGKWDIWFVKQAGDSTKNVGVFATDNAKILTGSILTNAGDLRYLEGSYTENGFQLSAFAGLNPYLIKGEFQDKDNFTGEFYTAGGVTKLVGKRNSEAALADPYSLTYMKKGYDRIDFTLSDVDGNKVSLSDPQFKDKVVIVSLLGSWCPNCLDEMEYLAPWYKENKDRGVEIVGLAFERKDDPEYVKKVLSRLKDRYDVTYPILFAGKLGDESANKVLPALNKIVGYPTTIFIDKKGVVRKIHTGFNGPATGLFYEEFKKDFNQVVDELLAE